MANEDRPRKSGGEFRDDLDELLSRANPNPKRIGCLPSDVLAALAARAQPIGDPLYEHLLNCSECYREFRRIQDSQLGDEGAS